MSLITISSFAGVAGLILALAYIHSDNLVFSTNKLVDIIGILVASTGLFFTGLFAIFAIKAYSHIKSIQDSKKDIQDSKETVARLLKDYACSIYKGMDMQIYIAEKGKGKLCKLRDELRLEQARLSYHYPMLDEEIRKQLLLRLGNIGEKEDIELIREIMINEKNMSNLAELALDSLKKIVNV